MSDKIFTVIHIDTGIKYTCECEEVSVCPMCHCALLPRNIAGYYVPDEGVSLLNLCPKCKRIFLVKYNILEIGNAALTGVSIIGTYPKIPDNQIISAQIKNLSSKFASIYAQASMAETSNLNEICGIGYRKALEFLVKDYLCDKFPSEADDIKSEPLSVAIRRIDDGRIRVLSERATWIGNDETHYIRKHDSLDVREMKRFINAIIHYIESELAFKDALSIEWRK